MPVIAFCQNNLAQKDSAAKKLAPIMDKAIVYVVRPTFYGALLKLSVNCDSVKMGTLMAEKYLYAVVSPGTHTFTSKTENHATLTATFEAGKVYFIKQQIKMGFVVGEVGLILLSDEKGKKDLKKCSLSKDNVYSQ